MADSDSSLLNGQHFLIAEDEIIIAMLLEDIIERLGGQIMATAKSCDEAAAALQSTTINAVILDVHLSGGTSESVLTAAANRGVPVLICTGIDAQALPKAFRDLPMLKKPWQSEDVATALGSLLRTDA